jgi:mitochondrial import receptor subunit TOM40
LPSTSLNFKAVNPDFTSRSFNGILVGSVLQAITPRLSVGFESSWQKQAAPELGPGGGMGDPSATSTSLIARLVGADKTWKAAATIAPLSGFLTATYWKKLGEKIEAGVSLDLKAQSAPVIPQGGGLIAAGGIQRVREGTATLGLKYDFRASLLRAQIDSGGRVSTMLEKRISPQITLVFCGDMDHFKVNYCNKSANDVQGVAKVGLGITIEASDVPEDQYPQSYMETGQAL